MTDLRGPQLVRGTAVNPQVRPSDPYLMGQANHEVSKVSVGANVDLASESGSKTPASVEWRHGTVVVF